MSIFEELMGKEKTEVFVSVERDRFTDIAANAFDYDFTGTTTFEVWDMPEPPKDFSLGMIVGDSGTGKSLLLKKFGEVEAPKWERNKAIISHFSEPDIALEKMMNVGLNSIPTWMKPFHVLSMGEQYRATLARTLKTGAVFDEFTSVVDRETAKSVSRSVRRYVDQQGLQNIVVASCHEDIIPWLQPDWVFNTNTGEMSVGRSLRPSIELQIFRTDISNWGAFAPHHYLNHDINPASFCYVAVWGEKAVGFCSVMTFPSGTLKNAFRGHRTVILPKFQGLGIGVRLSNAIAKHYVDRGGRYFSKTAHPRMGLYRENSSLWKPTSKNLLFRKDEFVTIASSIRKENRKEDRPRLCFSHEYVG